MERTLETLDVDGTAVDVVEVEEDGEIWYDLYVDGACINLGEPLYEQPTVETVRSYLD